MKCGKTFAQKWYWPGQWGSPEGKLFTINMLIYWNY